MGEIQNMPGHCVVRRSNGDILDGYHTDNFIDYTSSIHERFMNWEKREDGLFWLVDLSKCL